jgi:hypothetical protein
VPYVVAGPDRVKAKAEASALPQAGGAPGRPEAAVLTSLRKEPSRPHSAVDMRMEGRDGFAVVSKYVASRLRATASGLAALSAPMKAVWPWIA